MKPLIRRGLAPGLDVTRHLSLNACRRDAVQARPDTIITPWTAPNETGIYLGRQARRSRRLYVPFQGVLLMVAGPRMWKSALIGQHIADKPAGGLVTSTRADVFFNSAPWLDPQLTLVANPECLGGVESTLRFALQEGCADPTTAHLRAGYILAGNVGGGGAGDRKFWEGNARKVLRCLLMAADFGGFDMRRVALWVNNLANPEPLRVLEEHCPEWASELEGVSRGDARRFRESVTGTLAPALEFMSVPELADLACPPPGESVDVESLIRRGGTIFLLGTDREHAPLSPLFAAIAGHTYETAKRIAGERRAGRLDPPFPFILDEAHSICRLPLHRMTNVCAGLSIPIIVSLQSFDQLVDKWGENEARIIRGNTTVTMVGGGQHSAQTLKDFSEAYIGNRSMVMTTAQAGGGSSRIMQRVPVFEPQELRQQDPMRALVIHRSTDPVEVTVEPVWKRWRPAHFDVERLVVDDTSSYDREEAAA